MQKHDQVEALEAQLRVLKVRLDAVGLPALIVSIERGAAGEYAVSEIDAPGRDSGELKDLLKSPVPILPGRCEFETEERFSDDRVDLTLEASASRVALNVARLAASQIGEMTADAIEVSLAMGLAKVSLDGEPLRVRKEPDEEPGF